MAYYKCGRIHPTQNSNVVVDTASGAVANFQTPLAMPLLKTRFDFNATQEAGTPTPDDPKAISGVSEINYTQCKKNLVKPPPPSKGYFWGTDFPALVTALNKLPVGTYTLSNVFKIDEIPSPGTDKKTSVQHGPIKIYAGSISVNSVSQTRDTNATKNKTYTEQTTFEITEDIKGNITRALLYCDKYNTHNTGSSGRGKYSVYNIMVELGSTKTSYATHNGISDVIQLGNTYYGGYITQDKDGKRELVVTHNIKLFSDLDFRRSNSSGSWASYVFFAQMSDKTNKSAVKCSNYDYITQSIASMQNETITSGSSNEYIYIRDDNYTDVPTFKTANANTQLWYELAEPFTVALPDGEPIKSFPGINNIFCDTGNTSLQFRKIG